MLCWFCQEAFETLNSLANCSVSIWINVQFFSWRFWRNACAMLSIRNTRSAMGSAGALLPCLCWLSSPSPCVSLWWNWNESFSDRGNSQHLHRHQTNGATKSFAKILIKIGLGFLLMVSRQNTHLPTTPPRRQQCLCCLSWNYIQGMGSSGAYMAQACSCGNQTGTSFAVTSHTQQTHTQPRYRQKKRAIFG